jgi:hypothetical protein
MNGRKLFREYAQSFGKDAKEFVRIEEGVYQSDTLVTKDASRKEERTCVDYKGMVKWIIKTKKTL